jgi:hypothetical protein
MNTRSIIGLALLAIPVAAQAQTHVNATAPTHFVTPGGNAWSSCSATAPCSLARAFALAGTPQMPAGSWVQVAPGIYNQAPISTRGGGLPGFPIRFVGAGTDYVTGSRLTGTRTSLPAAVWTLCEGQTYTYCTPFDDAAPGYVVALMAQRPPVATWVPIVVKDRADAVGLTFALDEPVRYGRKWSTAAVEAQHCTFFHDTTNNVLKMHPCGELAPTDADNYYAGPDRWGTITFTGNGDHLSLEGFSIEHTTGQGILINPSVGGTKLANIRMLGSMMWAKGFGTVATDITILQAMGQGNPHIGCYSEQYGGSGFASRSCWNAHGDGYNLVLGQERSGHVYNQTFDRVRLEKGWNGVTISETNTLNHALIWGFANHAAVSSGPGVTVRNSIILNTQDAWFLADESWATHTFEHNLFYGSVLFWCGREGSANGAICPVSPPGWVFRHNIVATMNTDWMSEPTLSRDCNVWMPRNSTQDLLRISQQADEVTVDFKTLDGIRLGTANDDNSISQPSDNWYNRTLFPYFTSERNYPVNLTLAPSATAALTTCGKVAGPDTLAPMAPAHTGHVSGPNPLP